MGSGEWDQSDFYVCSMCVLFSWGLYSLFSIAMGAGSAVPGQFLLAAAPARAASRAGQGVTLAGPAAREARTGNQGAAGTLARNSS